MENLHAQHVFRDRDRAHHHVTVDWSRKTFPTTWECAFKSKFIVFMGEFGKWNRHVAREFSSHGRFALELVIIIPTANISVFLMRRFVEIKNRRLCVWKMTEIPYYSLFGGWMIQFLYFCGIVEIKSGNSRKLHSNDDNEKSWKKHHSTGIWKTSISMLNNQSSEAVEFYEFSIWHSKLENNFNWEILKSDVVLKSLPSSLWSL